MFNASFFFAYFSFIIMNKNLTIYKEVLCMKKFDWNKPFSRKDWLVLTLVVSGVSLAIAAIYNAILFGDQIKDWIRNKIGDHKGTSDVE